MRLSSRRLLIVTMAIAFCWMLAVAAHANPSQEDVFKSISDNMGAKTDNSYFIAGMAIVAGAAIMIGLFTRQKSPAAKKQSLNSPAKLMKEIVRATSLRPVEIKYLKALAERESLGGPLTLMLCPSVLLKAGQSGTKKEKRVLIQVARKLGIALRPVNPQRTSPAMAA